jgi:hypothetical protein
LPCRFPKALLLRCIDLQRHFPCLGKTLAFPFKGTCIVLPNKVSCLAKALRLALSYVAKELALPCKGTSMLLNSLEKVALLCLDLQSHFPCLTLQNTSISFTWKGTCLA